MRNVIFAAPFPLDTTMRFARAASRLDGVRLLRAETVRLLMTPQNGVGSVSGRAERGLNMAIAEDAFAPGRTFYGHSGGAYGGTAEFGFEPETKCGVVMATTGGRYRAIRPFARVGHDTVTAMVAALDLLRGNACGR